MASIRTQNERYEVTMVWHDTNGYQHELQHWTHYLEVARSLARGMAANNPGSAVHLKDHYPTPLDF